MATAHPFAAIHAITTLKSSHVETIVITPASQLVNGCVSSDVGILVQKLVTVAIRLVLSVVRSNVKVVAVTAARTFVEIAEEHVRKPVLLHVLQIVRGRVVAAVVIGVMDVAGRVQEDHVLLYAIQVVQQRAAQVVEAVQQYVRVFVQLFVLVIVQQQQVTE